MNDTWWHNRFYSAGCRLTAPREIVINILLKTYKHLSVEEIYLEALKVNPSIGLTTIYRTLDLLTQIGVVQKFDFGDRKARYEMTNESKNVEHHHHLICIRCKKIINYNDYVDEELQLMKKTEEALSKKHHFKISHHTIHFYGLCEECQKMQK